MIHEILGSIFLYTLTITIKNLDEKGCLIFVVIYFYELRKLSIIEEYRYCGNIRTHQPYFIVQEILQCVVNKTGPLVYIIGPFVTK